MKKAAFTIKKFTARVMIAVGALMGLSSCFHAPTEKVYGPPPERDHDIDVIKLVYGPPPVEPNVEPDTTISEPVPEQGDTTKVSSSQ